MATTLKKNAPKAPSKAQSANAVITPRLQLGFVALYALSYLSMVAPLIYTVTRYQSDYYMDNWMQFLSIAMPIVLFMIAFWYVGKLGTKLARVFKATFLSLLGAMIYIAVQMAVSYLPFLRPDTNENWQSAYMYQQLVVNITVVVMFGGALAYVKWQRKNRRG